MIPAYSQTINDCSTSSKYKFTTLRILDAHEHALQIQYHSLNSLPWIRQSTSDILITNKQLLFTTQKKTSLSLIQQKLQLRRHSYSPINSATINQFCIQIVPKCKINTNHNHICNKLTPCNMHHIARLGWLLVVFWGNSIPTCTCFIWKPFYICISDPFNHKLFATNDNGCNNHTNTKYKLVPSE